MKRFYLWLAVCLVPGIGAQEAVTQEEIRVVFRDIRVHVTDRKGNPITGLKPSDFVLREGGSVRKITFFDEVNGIKKRRETRNDALGPTLEEPDVSAFGEGSNIVIILDSSNMRMEAFPEFKEVIREFIEENIGPEHSVKLVQLENQLLHLSPFLNDKEALLAALDQAEYQGAQVTQLRRLERQVTYSFSYFLQPGLIQDAEEMALERGNYLIPLKDAVRQKTQLKREFFINFEFSLRQLARILDQMTGSKSVYLFSGGGFVTSNNFMKPTKPLSNALGRALNSANMTVYSFVHIPRRSLFDQFADTDTIDLRNQRNPIRELGSPYKSAAETIFENEVDLVTGPYEASANTGGVTKGLNRLSHIKESFREFNRSVQHYYRLGYTIEAPEKSTNVKIDLTGDKKGMRLHYGKSFDPMLPYIEMDADEKLIAFEASLAYARSFRNDLDADWGYVGFRGDGREEVIPVFIQIRPKRFAEKGYDIGFGAINEYSNLIDYTKTTVRHQSDKMEVMFYDLLLPKGRPKAIRFQMINLDNGEKSLFELPYDRSFVKADQFHVSGLTLATDREISMVALNHLRKDPETKKFGFDLKGRRKINDPFYHQGSFFKPALNQSFSSTKHFFVFFQLRNTQWPVEEFGISYTLTKDGEEVPSRLQMLSLANPEEGVHNCRGKLETGDLEPGSYQLKLDIRHDRHKDKAGYTHRFNIEPEPTGG